MSWKEPQESTGVACSLGAAARGVGVCSFLTYGCLMIVSFRSTALLSMNFFADDRIAGVEDILYHRALTDSVKNVSKKRWVTGGESSGHKGTVGALCKSSLFALHLLSTVPLYHVCVRTLSCIFFHSSIPLLALGLDWGL